MKKSEATTGSGNSFRVRNYGVPGSITPIDRTLWNHPVLAFYQEPKVVETPKVPAKLYLKIGRAHV